MSSVPWRTTTFHQQPESIPVLVRGTLPRFAGLDRTLPASIRGGLPPQGCTYVQKLSTGERATDMLARASAAGFMVSERQLERWHQEGLMPRPVQIWTEGSAGSCATYPAGSGDQLLMLCIIRQKYRRSSNVGWLLWWLGFSVDENFWMGALKSLAALYESKLAIAINSAHRRAGISDLKKYRTPNVIFRRLRKRVGPEDFDIVMTCFAEIINGQFDGWGLSFDKRKEDAQREKTAIGKALGITIQRKVKNADGNSDRDTEIETALLFLSNRLGGLHLLEVLRDCSLANLLRARDQLRCVLTMAQSISNQAEGKFDGATAGMMKIFSQYAIFLKPRDQGLLLLFLLALREDQAFSANLCAYTDLFGAEVIRQSSPEKLEFLRRYAPALANLLSG
jgi:hypothetical protein